jgi:pyridoxal phosphate enzyme (YggS family)
MAALLAATTRRLLRMSTATAPGAARTVAAASASTAATDAAPSSSCSSGAVAAGLCAVRERAAAAAQRANRNPESVRVVAVSKTKPAEALLEAYSCGQRDFGENYVQELLEKAPALPSDVRWRFIGHLQSNKARALVEGVPGLVAVETVDSAKLADKLDAAVAGARAKNAAAAQGGGAAAGAAAAAASPPAPLDVFVQVNTSGEESKHGVEPGDDCVTLARHVAERCPNLRLAGVMTIGQPDYSSRPENFVCLAECRSAVAKALGLSEEGLELSMGMSGDFEQAVEMGSTNVRVGSTIFGARDYGAAAAAKK